MSKATSSDRDGHEPLLEHLLARHSREPSSGQRRLGEGARRRLVADRWLGNVRELANAVERMVVLRVSDELSVTIYSRRFVTGAVA